MNITRQAGFTLVEIMIAVGLFAFGILALATMQVSSIRGNASSEAITEAGNLASAQIETLMALNYTDAALDPGDHSGNQALTVGRHTISWNVANNVPAPNNKTLNIIVTWKERGVDKTFSLQTVRAR